MLDILELIADALSLSGGGGGAPRRKRTGAVWTAVIVVVSLALVGGFWLAMGHHSSAGATEQPGRCPSTTSGTTSLTPDVALPEFSAADIQDLVHRTEHITGATAGCWDGTRTSWPVSFISRSASFTPSFFGTIAVDRAADLTGFPQQIPKNAGLGGLTCYDKVVNRVPDSTARPVCVELFADDAPAATAWLDEAIAVALKGPGQERSGTVAGIPVSVEFTSSTGVDGLLAVSVGPAFAAPA